MEATQRLGHPRLVAEHRHAFVLRHGVQHRDIFGIVAAGDYKLVADFGLRKCQTGFRFVAVGP